jgi:hypothetical protein
MEVDEKMEEPVAQGAERRTKQRFTVDKGSQLFLVSHGLAMVGRVLDLSLDGCRMETWGRFTGGVRARVEVTFKINGIAFRFCGLTQWTDGRNQVGIHFVDVTERRREELAEVIGEVEEDLGVKARKKAAGKLEAERRAGEEQGALEREARQRAAEEREARERASQAERARVFREEAGLQAAQQGTMRRVGEQHAPQPGAPPPATKPPAKPGKGERRAELRHEVDTSATIYLIKIGSRQSGRILDLSSSGCHIRTDERFPVGIYTRVETEFRLEGLPFRLAGVIQAIHDRDRHEIGIRFLDLSERKRVQLEQLIVEIEEMRALRTPIK